MIEWIAHWVAAGGYWGVGLLMAIENVFLPLPSELIMPLAGFASARGHLKLGGVILAGTLGGALGSLPLYIPARIYGSDRVADWIGRHGKWLLMRKRDVDKAHKRFERSGGFWAVFISQLLPGIRGLISLPAGFAEMNVVLFLIANFAGTAIWCTVLAYLGMFLGTNYSKVNKYVGPAGWMLLAVAVTGVGVWLWRRKGRKPS